MSEDVERYELVEGASAKFWEAEVSGTTLTVRYGRIGTQGQSKDKTFADAAAAVKEKDKLVREKTAKGYARAGGGPPAAAAPAAKAKTSAKKEAPAAAPPDAVPVVEAPAPAAEPEPIAVAPSRAVFAGTPLPTRLRPGRHLTAEEAWQAVRAPLAAMIGEAEAERLSATMPPPDAIGGWITSVAEADEGRRKEGRHSWGANPEMRRFLEAVMRSLVESGGTMTAVRLADASRPPARKRGHYQDLSWAEPLHLALRAALVHSPEAEYDAAVAFLNERIAQQPDWPSAAFFAFILADDRPGRHDLQPLAVLEAAAAAGVEVGADTNFLPLVVDADPAVAARWRAKRSWFLYLSYGVVEAAEAAATLIAVARASGQPALPGLDWLMHYMIDDQRTAVAQAMLSTGEAGALPALVPHLHEKPVTAGIDAALAADPAAIVPRCIAVLASGRPEPALRARVVRALDTYGAAAVRGWLEPVGGRAAAFLDGIVSARDVPLADKAAWPRVLRDPPWRRKTRSTDDIVLDLPILPTPFAFEKRDVPESYWRAYHARVLGDIADLPAFIAEAEEHSPGQSWIKIPAALSAPPQGDTDALLIWLGARLKQIDDNVRYWSPSPYRKLIDGLEKQPEPLALMLWSLSGIVASASHVSLWPEIVATMLARFGERAVPGLVALIETDPIGLLPNVLTVDEAAIAPPAARALLKLKKAREPALVWLRRHRRTAITRLIPEAVGRPGPGRDAAEHTLRVLAADREDGRREIEAIVAAYAEGAPRVAEAVTQVLDRDPLAQVPAKVAKPPAWLVPGSLARPLLLEGGALPDEAVLALGEMLSFANPDAVYAGIPMVREACTGESLAAFAWDLFSAWTAAGTPSKDGWALRALGWFGDDDTARNLTRLIRRWPGESAHARAVTGLDVLVDIGSDVALMNLNGIAEKLKFKGLQEKARQKIAQLAESRGLSPEELSDRLAPDLDLDERGGLDLDFGPRRFRAGFDESLKPWVKDEAGQRLKDLPKPVKADDTEKAASASARWSALKKDARAVASLQVARLEAMLASSRRVRPEVFRLFFAAHPLVRHLTQRLVWATFSDADPRTPPSATFRVAEDLSFTDAADEPVEIDVSAEASGMIGLLHPLHRPEGLADWGTLFGDYEIAQPFPQLGRETYAFTEAEKAASRIKRFEGIAVEAKRIRGMPARGWRLGDPQDAGCVWWIQRPAIFAKGAAHDVYLNFGDGLFTGASDFEEKEQTLGELSIETPWSTRNREVESRFGELDPVAASELLRGPSLLAETRLR